MLADTSNLNISNSNYLSLVIRLTGYECQHSRKPEPLGAIIMNQLLFAIFFILTISGCTHHQTDTSQDKRLTNISTSQVLFKDSIDKHGLSSCVKPFHNELNTSFKKAVDSAWNILVTNDKTNKFSIIHSKDKFKDALIANHFIVDSSDKWITATKRGFNERWQAEWDKDSNYVQLVMTRWYNGYTYNFMIGSDKFDK